MQHDVVAILQKAGVYFLYRVLKRDGYVVEFDRRIIKKLFIDAYMAEFKETFDMLLFDIEKAYSFYAELLNDIIQKGMDYLREIIHLIHIQNILMFSLWDGRNNGVGRSKTSAVSDMMLLSIPTPPTAMTASSSLRQRGISCGAVA